MIGLKILQPDGTSLNGKHRYDLKGTWQDVPGNGSYIATGYRGLVSARDYRRGDLLAVIEGDGERHQTGQPDEVSCCGRVRVRGYLKGAAAFYAHRAYQKATAPAEEAYLKATATEWEAYQQAKATAWEAYQKATATAEEAYQKAATAEEACQKAATAEEACQKAATAKEA